jgi:hypothetical protein
MAPRPATWLLARPGFRFNARTRKPLASNALAVSPPIPPVAPMINAVCFISVSPSAAAALCRDDVESAPSRRETELAKARYLIYIYV